MFFINLPVALAVLGAGWTLVGAERRERGAESAPDEGTTLSRRSVDWLGALLLTALLTAQFIPLTFSPLWGWGSIKTVALLLAAAAFFVAFVLREHRAEKPMLGLDLLRKNPVVAVACSAAFVYSVGMFASLTLTAVYIEVVQGRSAEQAGLMLLIQPILMVLLSPMAGRLSNRVGTRPLTCLGGLFLTAGLMQLAFAAGSRGRVLLGLATVGVGMALCSPPNMSAIMGAVPRHQLNLGSGFQAAARFGGQGFSIAVLGSIAAWKLGHRRGAFVVAAARILVFRQREQAIRSCLPTSGASSVVPTQRQAALGTPPTLFFVFHPFLHAHIADLCKVRWVFSSV